MYEYINFDIIINSINSLEEKTVSQESNLKEPKGYDAEEGKL